MNLKKFVLVLITNAREKRGGEKKKQFSDKKKLYICEKKSFTIYIYIYIYIFFFKKKKLYQYLTTNMREKCGGRRKNYIYIYIYINLAKNQDFLNY